jgi:hypothetical protein
MGFKGGPEMQDEFRNENFGKQNNGRTVGRSVNPPASRGNRNTLEDSKQAERPYDLASTVGPQSQIGNPYELGFDRSIR